MSTVTKRDARKSLWFWAFLVVTIYVMLSVSVAVATADHCDGHLGATKSWSFVPPHWQCPRAYGP